MYKKIEKLGFLVSIIFGLSIFTSKALQNLSGSLLLLIMFVMLMMNIKEKKIWNNLKSKCDKEISIGFLVLLLLTFIIFIINFDGKTSMARDITRYLTFFPLIYFIDTENKIKKFLLTLGASGIISLLAALGVFIKNYNEWNKTDGIVFYRVTFGMDPLAYAGVISIFMIFIFSFLFFMKTTTKQKILLVLLVCLGVFILLVNRGKTAYVSFVPALAYLCTVKSKKAILILIATCLVGFQFLPTQIKQRATYIVNYQKDPSSILRTYFWQGAVESIKEKPLIGFKSSERQKFLEEYYGKTGKKEYINKYFGYNYLEVHNTYLQYWVQFGSIAFLYLCFFLFILIPKKLLSIKSKNYNDYMFIRFLKHGVIAAFISYSISGLTETTILKQVMIYVFIVLLMLVNYMNVENKKI